MSQGGVLKKGGGGGPSEGGGEGAGPGYEPHTQWGKRTQGRGQSNHGIRPRPQRGWRFRKLPPRHPVAHFKGEDLKGGALGGFGIYFQSVDTYGRRSLGWVSA